MKKGLLKTVGFLSLCALLSVGTPKSALAAPIEFGPGYQTSTTLVVKVDGMNPALYAKADAASEVIGQASKGNTYSVLESAGDGWVKISTGEVEGYLNTAAATVAETAEEVRDTSTSLRQDIVSYAKRFVGNRYVYGGTNPNTGVDCSGFTAYVMRNVAGVSLSHSSRAQAGEGRSISASQVRPGDLVFYSQGGTINHVAIYIGNGQIVHASNRKDGIKISNWTYRSPARIVNVLGD